MKYSFIVLLFLSCYCSAAKRDAGRGYPFSTISAAVQSASRYDTVIIHPGTYSEGTLTLTTPVSLIGSGLPVIDGRSKNELISVKCDSVLISGIHFMNSGHSSLQDIAAVKVYNAKHVTVIDNRFTNTFFGIYLLNSSYCEISRNILKGQEASQQNSGNGIHLWKSNHIHIEGNSITGHRDGIYFEFVTKSVIAKNVSEKNLRYGLHFMFSNDDVYTENTFRNNGAGVSMMFTSNIVMQNNIFIANWGSGSYGILLKEIRDSKITGNRFEENTTAIHAEGISRVMITGNTFTRNGWALDISSSCDQMSLTKNNFTGNTFDLNTTGNGNMTVNNFDGNYWDKYEGYDLNRDKTGDVPYHPVSLSGVIVGKIPGALFFLHCFVLNLIDQSEKLVPQLIPEDIVDNKPLLKQLPL